jgi:hypothetical protein
MVPRLETVVVRTNHCSNRRTLHEISEGNDAPMTGRDLADVLWIADSRFQAVDQVETWIRKTTVHVRSGLVSFAGPGASEDNQAPATRVRASAGPTTRS